MKDKNQPFREIKERLRPNKIKMHVIKHNTALGSEFEPELKTPYKKLKMHVIDLHKEREGL